MKAVIFAAGLGTRLSPLTDNKPKALVEVAGKTLLEHAIDYLKKNGIREFIINIHHYGDLILEFLENHNDFGVSIQVSDERKKLLNTGGGLIKMEAWLKKEPFLVYNVDIITDTDLQKMIVYHDQNNALATLAIQRRDTSRYLLFDEDYYLRGWKNSKSGEVIYTGRRKENLNAFAFSGIHIIDPAVFTYKPEESVFSIIQWYLDLAKDHLIGGYVHNDSFWLDAGKPSSLQLAENYLANP